MGLKGARISAKGARISEKRAIISAKGARVPVLRVRKSEGFSCDVTRVSRCKDLYDVFGCNRERAYEHFASRNTSFQSCVRWAVRVHKQVHHPRWSREGQKRSQAIIHIISPSLKCTPFDWNYVINAMILVMSILGIHLFVKWHNTSFRSLGLPLAQRVTCMIRTRCVCV